MTNHKPVTPAEHAAEAVAHLEAVKVFRLQLLDTYDRTAPDRARIAELHQAIGFGLKLAEVHALLALVPQTPMRDQRQRSTEDRVFVDGVTL